MNARVPGRFDRIVRGGRLAPLGTRADIGIVDGRIAAIAEALEDAPRIVEAAGRLVLPGGVDAHCHMDQPSYGAACADDFASGTAAAAHGGTTTVIPFAMAQASDSLLGTVAAYRARAEGKALIDYAIHPTVQAASARTLANDLPALIGGGYASLKVFTTYEGFRLDDRDLLAVMEVAARHGALMMVHAENDALIAFMTKRLIEGGHHAPLFHAPSRPVAAEREAIGRLAAFAEVTGAEVMIVHVSTREGLEEITRAQARGVRIHAETCPHYLLLDETDLDREGLDGARFICSPPLRRATDRAALWAAMERGLVSVYASDHSPHRLAGTDGKFGNGADSRFDQIANGVPGLELRMPLLFSEGYLKGRLSLAQFVDLTAANPARLHGIAPRKGSIAVGSDADLVIWDERRETTVDSTVLHDRVDYSPYEGMRIKGWPAIVLSRGEVVVENGTTVARPGRGRFVPSAPRPPSVGRLSEPVT